MIVLKTLFLKLVVPNNINLQFLKSQCESNRGLGHLK